MHSSQGIQCIPQGRTVTRKLAFWYASALTVCILSFSLGVTAIIVFAQPTETQIAKNRLPKPTPNCPDCQDANTPSMASVKE